MKKKCILCFRTPSRVSPKIDGKDIDLYLLYVLVTAQGGWVKVSLFNFVLMLFIKGVRNSNASLMYMNEIHFGTGK